MFKLFAGLRNILAKEYHEVDGRELEVSRYYDCLGLIPPHHDARKPGCRIPKSVRVTGFNPRVLGFIQRSRTCQKFVNEKMNQVEAIVEWQDYNDTSNDIVMTCTIKNAMENAFELADNWKQTAPNTFLDVLKEDFAFEQIDASEDVWQMYCGRIFYVQDHDHNKVLVDINPYDYVVSVVGRISEVVEISARLRDDLLKAHEDIKRAAMEITETMSGFTLPDLRMLYASGLVSKQREKKVKVDVDMERLEVSFTGLPDDVRSAEIAMYNDTLNRMTKQMVDMSCPLISQMKNIAMMKYMSKKFRERKVVGVYDFVGDSTLAVYALSVDHLRVAIETVKHETYEKTVAVPPSDILATETWNGLIKDVQSQYVGLCTVSVDTDGVTLTGAARIVEKAVVKINKFLDENTTLNESMSVECGKVEYMTRCMEKEIDGIRQTSHPDSVEIIGTMDEPCGFVVTGTRQSVPEAVRKLQTLATEIKVEQISADKPGMSYFLASPVGQLSLSRIESQQPVMIKSGEKHVQNGSSTDVTTLKTPEGVVMSLCESLIESEQV